MISEGYLPTNFHGEKKTYRQFLLRKIRRLECDVRILQGKKKLKKRVSRAFFAEQNSTLGM
jgi:hypothetical protein